jgi:hypothetical protein
MDPLSVLVLGLFHDRHLGGAEVAQLAVGGLELALHVGELVGQVGDFLFLFLQVDAVLELKFSALLIQLGFLDLEIGLQLVDLRLVLRDLRLLGELQVLKLLHSLLLSRVDVGVLLVDHLHQVLILLFLLV